LGVSEKALFDLISKITQGEDEAPTNLGSIAKSMVDEWANNPVQNIGIPLPWPKVNASIGGGLRTGVHLFAARTKVGKTSLGIMSSIFVAEMGIPVLILDREMKTKSILPKLLANLSQVEINDIEKGVFANDALKRKKVDLATSQLEKMRIDHKNISGITDFDEVISIIRRWIYKNVGLRRSGEANQFLLVYDYFKITDSKELDRIREDQALGFQITKLVDFANKFDFPCLSFAQLNREGTVKEDSTAIAGSDRLAQLANSITIFKRKEEKEIEIDGPQGGNRKMITTDSRYGGEAQSSNDHIHMEVSGEYCTLKEVSFVKKQDRKL
jgi:replicative DNA helicase